MYSTVILGTVFTIIPFKACVRRHIRLEHQCMFQFNVSTEVNRIKGYQRQSERLIIRLSKH